MILYGEGDHGGGPRDADVDAVRKLGPDKSQPKMLFATPEAYFKILEKRAADLPAFAGELNFTFPACYTTQVETKKNNRRAEALLVTAEKFSALAVASGFRDYYPERDIDEAWKVVLRNQFHDILDGSSIGPVYEDVGGFYQGAMDRGRRALDFSLETITDQIDTRGEGLPFVIYNPLAWERTEPVIIDIPSVEERRSFIITDPDGFEVPCQALPSPPDRAEDSTRVVFIAKNVPALGYAVYRAVPSDKTPTSVSGVKANAATLENEFFKVVLDPNTGWVRSVFDKNAEREILAGPANILQAIVDEPPNMSAWELGLKDQFSNIGETGARVETVESGPVRAVVRVGSPFRRSSFSSEIILYAGIPRVDFRLRLNWQERNLMIKAAFPLAVRANAAEFEIPYGSVTRPANGKEAPALRWIDVDDASGDYGVGLLNDSRYGFDVRANVARISIIHGATNPDPEADRGPHETMYALFPHGGTWKDAAIDRRGYEFNNSLLPRLAMAHPGKLGPRHSFLSVEPSNIVLSAVKKEAGYDKRGVIFRLYETQGRATEARVVLPWAVSASETDLIERPLKPIAVEGNVLTVKLEPYEIKTVRVSPKAGPGRP
jgi:alpha-mannosidase